MGKTIWIMPWQWAGALGAQSGYKFFRSIEDLENFFQEYKEGELLNRPVGSAVEVPVDDSSYENLMEENLRGLTHEQIDEIYRNARQGSNRQFTPQQGLRSFTLYSREE